MKALGLLDTGKRWSETATLRDELLHLCVVDKTPSSLDYSHGYFMVQSGRTGKQLLELYSSEVVISVKYGAKL